MRKIHETEFNGWDETAEAIIIYELEEGEYEKLDEEFADDFDKMLEALGYHSQWGCVMPGARYTRYYLERITPHHLIIARVDALNV